jgi:pimeloyl-ACP methyl ester carboxylesterase
MIWISTCLPYPTASPQNPKAPPQSAWDAALTAIRQDRPNFIADGFRGPFGVGTSGSVTDKQIAFFENIFWENDPIALERCLQIFSREDLSVQIERFGQLFQKPFLLIHGGGDGGVPAEVSAELVQKSVPGAKLIIYNEGGHGELAAFNAKLSMTNQDRIVLVLNYADRLLDDIVNFVADIAGRD